MGKTKDDKYTFSLDLYLERHIPSFKSLVWDHGADSSGSRSPYQIYFQDTKNRACGSWSDENYGWEGNWSLSDIKHAILSEAKIISWVEAGIFSGLCFSD